jgi:chromosomal replication initiation ATPase DnaA
VRLLAYSRLHGRPVTLPLARELLRIDPRGPGVSRHGAARVQDVVAAEWSVTPEALISKRRLVIFSSLGRSRCTYAAIYST